MPDMVLSRTALGKVDALAMQHQAPCPRPAVILLITFCVKLESRRLNPFPTPLTSESNPPSRYLPTSFVINSTKRLYTLQQPRPKLKIFIPIVQLLRILIINSVPPLRIIPTSPCHADPKPVRRFPVNTLSTAFAILATRTPTPAFRVIRVETNLVVPCDEATRIAAVSVDVGFAVVTGCAVVVCPSHFAQLGMLDCKGGSLDQCRRHVFIGPALLGRFV
jgi:hypothetical protein